MSKCSVFLTSSFCFLLLCNVSLFGQQSFFLSIEPNLMLADREITSSRDDIYFKNKSSLGVGVNFGYQKDLKKNFYYNAYSQALVLRSAVSIDYEGSGFNKLSEIKYSKETFGLDYIMALGLGLSGGYKIDISEKSWVKVGVGGHVNFSGVSSGGGVLVSTQKQGNASLASVYSEEINEYKFPYVFCGADVFVNYFFNIGNQTLFSGLHYSYNPGKKIKGNYSSFSDFTFKDSGTFELSKSYVGLNLGIVFKSNKSTNNIK